MRALYSLKRDSGSNPLTTVSCTGQIHSRHDHHVSRMKQVLLIDSGRYFCTNRIRALTAGWLNTSQRCDV